MTDNLLQKLEERTMMLLTEIESLRNRVSVLTRENTELKSEYNTHMKKVRELIALVESLDIDQDTRVNNIERLPEQAIYATS
ncbi:MAG: hypothetical protein SFW66_06615 [Gammaproteobacteria bacterium]|nr:hypothetical protein [Gammaproteobacteria bacterium]